MTQHGWANAPQAVCGQIEALIAGIHDCLGNALTGIYLHGSLALGCFNPVRSDLDVLVVTQRAMTLAEKRVLADLLLRLSNQPSPIEISFLSEAQLHPWRYPTPYDFHYSEDWRQRMQADLADGGWQRWNDAERTDPDLAAHLTITRQSGIALVGPPARELLPPVPPADYRASILADVDFALKGAAENPVYVVLNLCRIYIYLQSGLVTSKDSGGQRALELLPESQQAVIRAALALYRGEFAALDAGTVQAWAYWMSGQIADLSNRG